MYDRDLVIHEITYENDGDCICLVSADEVGNIENIVTAKGHLIVESVLVNIAGKINSYKEKVCG